jgi:hypothetical protein
MKTGKAKNVPLKEIIKEQLKRSVKLGSELKRHCLTVNDVSIICQHAPKDQDGNFKKVFWFSLQKGKEPRVMIIVETRFEKVKAITLKADLDVLAEHRGYKNYKSRKETMREKAA